MVTLWFCTLFREGPSSSSGLSEPNKKKLIKENGGFNGDFLTLAPPKPKHTSSYLSLHSQEIPDFDALPYQVRLSIKQQCILPFRCFLTLILYTFIVIWTALMSWFHLSGTIIGFIIFQGTTDDPVHWPGPSRSIQQPFFSFLPSANTQNGQSAGTISNSNGEVVESVDLNLKL